MRALSGALLVGLSCLFVGVDQRSYAQENAVEEAATESGEAEDSVEELPAVQPATATASEGSMPEIFAHSEPHASVYQGDKIVLGVKAKGENLLYRWIRNFKTICSAANCRFDSSRWGVGAQNITVVIYNRYGSQNVTFTIRVLARPADRPFAEVEPKEVKAQKVETLSATDYFVKAVYGIGYGYKDRSDVRVLAQLPRALAWDETLRSHVQGLVQFGVKNTEEHLLTPSSSVLLRKSAEGRRIVELRSGTLRSRQLSLEAPTWSIVVGSWLQVDGDKKADFLISKRAKGADQTTVTVLRGQAQVLIRVEGESEPKAFYLYPGVSHTFTPDTKEANLHLPSTKLVDKYVRQSTPQYFLKKTEGKGRITSFLEKDITVKSRQPLQEALTSAKRALNDEDAVAALENLLPIYVKNKTSYDINYALGQTYALLNLYREAFKYFKEAATIEPKNPEPRFQTAMIYLRSGNWQKAKLAFAEAAKLNHPDHQGIEYQMGVSAFNLGEDFAARNHFRNALLNPTNQEIRASTESYLKGINDRRWYGAYARLSFGKDSNVFRWGGGGRTDSYTTESSLYYRGGLDLYLRAYESIDGTLLFGFDIDKIFYTESGADEISPMTQRLYMNWVFNVGATAQQKALVQFQFVPYIELLSIGEERSADTFGLDLKVAAARVSMSPYLRIAYANLSDPLPARDDLVDPVLREPVLPSDRSTKLSGYGLGVDLVNEGAKQFSIELMSTKSEHQESIISVDDYSEMSLALRGKTMVVSYVGLNFELGYATRNFSSSSDSRKDTAIGANMGAKYFLTPSFSTDLGIDYTSQKSNRSISSYNRNDLSLGISLEI